MGHPALLCSGAELGDDRGDVVALFVRTESANSIHDSGQQTLAWQLAMLAQRCDEVGLAEFFAALIPGFGDAIGVKGKHWISEPHTLNFAKRAKFRDGAPWANCLPCE